MTRRKLSSPGEDAESSGAAEFSVLEGRCLAVGADIALMANFGAGFTSGEEAMFSGPEFFSSLGISGAATSRTSRFLIFGAAILALKAICGLGCGEAAAHSTMLGSGVSIFGASAGAAG